MSNEMLEALQFQTNADALLKVAKRMSVGRLRLSARLPAEARFVRKKAGALDCQPKAREKNSSIIMLKIKMLSECPDEIERLSTGNEC